jgi:anti-anti-sigma factor
MPIERWSDSVVVAHLSDDPQFTEDLLSVEDTLGPASGDLVLDFAAVHFVNSSNLSRLLKLRKQILAHGHRVVLCSLSNQVWGAFLITGLDNIFEFAGNVPTALATLQLGT